MCSTDPSDGDVIPTGQAHYKQDVKSDSSLTLLRRLFCPSTLNGRPPGSGLVGKDNQAGTIGRESRSILRENNVISPLMGMKMCCISIIVQEHQPVSDKSMKDHDIALDTHDCRWLSRDLEPKYL